MRYLSTIVATSLLCATLHAQETSNAAMAKQLANPVAALVSVPFQLNYDRGQFEQGNSSYQLSLNIQPVVPFSLNDEYNIISRTIVPIVRTHEIPPGSGINGAVSDVVQTFFFSPKRPTQNGWMWGAGPVFLIPSGSDLSMQKWGAGAAVAFVKQENGWTYGLHSNYIASFAGSDKVTSKISQALIQPFATYTTPQGISYSIGSESTYNFEADTDRWTVPVQAGVSRVSKFGDQSMSYGCTFKYYATSPHSGPHGFGVKVFVTLMFPK